ncbi:Cof-type HAD-IIB family hydrolase [Lysinibacillus piscis]|uniref:Phosphatase n=1 Tax=Lysinibacillus piscis TaxID=2518931 RepID=A0ABQ5NH57_9BACI|nr:Cof-type HAD-IIB family hydrolase [Lysinibacillus sp. KH24]GLC87620.1 phosphatase [Lysinibacillus sp. KH24]
MDKIIFFDIDGTLYNDEKKIPQSAKEAVLAARRNGYEIAIATGRSPFMAKPILEELDIHTYVTFNGQYVVYQDEVIYANEIDKESLAKIAEFSASRDEPVVFLDDKHMVATAPAHHMVSDSLATLMHHDYPKIDATYYMQNPVYQTLAFVTEQDEPLYREKFPNVRLVRWHPYSCDILPLGGSKALGIEKVLEKMGLTMEDAIAFGDGLNDIEMLTAVGTSVAMGNAEDEVKAVAKYVTDHIDQDGIAKMLRELKIID